MSEMMIVTVQFQVGMEEKVRAVLGGEEDGGPDFWQGELNYGGSEYLRQLSEAGVPFIGSCDAKYEYPGMMFFGDGRGGYEELESTDGANPVITLDADTGKLHEGQLRTAHDFLAGYREVKNLVQLVWDWPSIADRFNTLGACMEAGHPVDSNADLADELMGIAHWIRAQG